MVNLRKASSMIELVIAIVVMGIALMTLPLMLERTQASNAFTTQQEAIHAAKTQLGDITTYPWDERAMLNNVVAVLDTDSPNFRRVAGTTRRVGHIAQNNRRKLFNSERNASDVGILLPNNIIDIGDFHSQNTKLEELNSTNIEFAGVLDYRYDFNMTTNIKYILDTPSNTFVFRNTGSDTNTTNIKMIEVTLQGNNIDKFTFRSYSSNIGESLLAERDYN